jgi:hypothetical protein
MKTSSAKTSECRQDAGICVALSGDTLFEFRINADVPLAGKMPALHTFFGINLSRAGKMPALHTFFGINLSRAGKMPALQ